MYHNVLQECMPVCVCVFPMKNILYICVSVIYAFPRCLSVSAPHVLGSEQGCPPQSRCVQVWPTVSRHAAYTRLDYETDRKVRLTRFPNSVSVREKNPNKQLHEHLNAQETDMPCCCIQLHFELKWMNLNEVIKWFISQLISLAECGRLSSLDSCVHWYIEQGEQDWA